MDGGEVDVDAKDKVTTAQRSTGQALPAKLRRRLEAAFPEIQVDALKLAVEETRGQRGFWRFQRQGA